MQIKLYIPKTVRDIKNYINTSDDQCSVVNYESLNHKIFTRYIDQHIIEYSF